jgi:hypothetical protein
MPCVGIEPTIPASKRAKTVHALDSSATVTGYLTFNRHKLLYIIIHFIGGKRGLTNWPSRVQNPCSFAFCLLHPSFHDTSAKLGCGDIY